MSTHGGFTFDSGDPSVGLFGTAWEHDECPIGDGPDDGVDELLLAVTRVDPWTIRCWYLLTCLDCAKQRLVSEDDMSPTDEAIAEQERAERRYEMEADAALAAAFDDDPSPYAGTYSEE